MNPYIQNMRSWENYADSKGQNKFCKVRCEAVRKYEDFEGKAIVVMYIGTRVCVFATLSYMFNIL